VRMLPPGRALNTDTPVLAAAGSTAVVVEAEEVQAMLARLEEAVPR